MNAAIKNFTGYTPPGWIYNPSGWSQRLPIVGLGFIGFLIAAYLGLYQCDIVEDVWEPFFENGSERVLNSSLSYVLPIPDAVLGAMGYLADVVTGIIGGTKRWKTMPWIVILFAILVGPLGLISIGLVIAQPVVYDAWCTLCLTSAVVSIWMIGPAMDEALASLQFMRRVKENGRHSAWRVFWGKEKVA